MKIEPYKIPPDFNPNLYRIPTLRKVDTNIWYNKIKLSGKPKKPINIETESFWPKENVVKAESENEVSGEEATEEKVIDGRSENKGRPKLAEEDRRQTCAYALPPATIKKIKALASAAGSQSNAIVAAVEALPEETPEALAWFWCTDTATLFLGKAGQTYEGSDEVEACGQKTSLAAQEVFTRQIAPWAETLIPKGKVACLIPLKIW
jgi:hypothetical protein